MFADAKFVKNSEPFSLQIDDITVCLIRWPLLVAICASKFMCFHGEVPGMLNVAEARPC